MSDENRKNKFVMKQTIKKRMTFLFVAAITALSYVGIFKVWQYKKTNGSDYEAAAIYNQINKIQDKVINPNRGDILDRNKQSLAVSSTVFNIVLDVRILAKQKPDVQTKTLNSINELLEIPMETLLSYTQVDGNGVPAKDTNYLVIAKKVPFDVGKQIGELGYSWLYAEEDTKRSYPHNTLAAQLVGFVRGDSIWGLESYYNDEMTGVPGRTFRTYEANNTITTRQENPKKGNTLVTTLDQTIQQFAEKASKEAYDAYNPVNTSVVVMNPHTGEVLAMAQYPSFNLNDPLELTQLEKSEFKKQWDTLSSDKQLELANKSWKNFNISETFEPGSIYKPIVAAMALEEGVISENDTFFCPGVKSVAGYEIHCHKTSGHGTITLEGVLADSCNVGMMEIMTKLGAEKYYKYQKDFGFGEKTGIDLPGEVSASTLLYSLEQLNTAEQATSSFGQGFNCTAIQALSAFNACINGGNLMKPYIVSQIVDENGAVVKENAPTVVRRVISTNTSDYIRKTLESVVKPGATGRKAIINGYAIGGKTGTAEQGVRGSNDYTLSFIAYLPVSDPDIVAMAVIHKPENYSDSSGISPVPMLREVLVDIINYKAIPPTYEGSDEEVSAVETNEVTLKDYTNKPLQETISDLNSQGVDFELIGGGGSIVTKQYPEANTSVTRGSKVLLYISQEEGKELISVPDVTGMDATSAQQMIEKVGFICNVAEDEPEVSEITTVAPEENDTAGENTEEATQQEASQTPKEVYEQIPVAGVKIEKGTIIKIKIR